jgi:hypothetical protein
MGGNPNFGDHDNMVNLLINAGYTNYHYRKIAMSYTTVSEVEHSRSATKEIFQGVKEKLHESGLFNLSDYPKVENEIDTAQSFIWHCGQVVAFIGQSAQDSTFDKSSFCSYNLCI